MRFASFRLTGCAGVVGLALLSASSGALAVLAPMDFYAGPAITDAMKADPRACLNVGDAVSCSAGMLNLLHQQYFGIALSPTGSTALSETNPTKVNGYVVAPSGQGQLKQVITLGSGGNGGNPNETILPDPTKAQDGFSTNNQGDQFAATGKTGTTAGNLTAPDINSMSAAIDQAGTWDVDLNWLIGALTLDQQRRELMIGFDFNQSQGAKAGTVDYWALITVLNYERNPDGSYKIGADGKGIILGEFNYEIKSDYSGYLGFTSTKTFDGLTSKPSGSEFSAVNTQTCYKLVAGIVTSVVPTTTGICPDGSYSTVNNASGDNSTEIIAFLPELNANLEWFAANSFDAISVRMLFGCFNDGDTNNNGSPDTTTGNGYLSGGSTSNCDGGGNVDVFLMAGAPMPTNETPEPGSLALFGVSLAGLCSVMRRRRSPK